MKKTIFLVFILLTYFLSGSDVKSKNIYFAININYQDIEDFNFINYICSELEKSYSLNEVICTSSIVVYDFALYNGLSIPDTSTILKDGDVLFDCYTLKEQNHIDFHFNLYLIKVIDNEVYLTVIYDKQNFIYRLYYNFDDLKSKPRSSVSEDNLNTMRNAVSSIRETLFNIQRHLK